MITVLNPGIYSTIQDLGRKGFAHIGVPISGAMDLHSASIGNQLLNNKNDAAVLEITFGHCKLRFEKATQVSITGADFNPCINGRIVAMNSVVKVNKGAILSFGVKNYGARSYLCVLGGFDADIILESKSFYSGVTASSQLKRGDNLVIDLKESFQQKTHSKIRIDTEYFLSNKIVVRKGPEFELLSEKQQNDLLDTIFTISNDNNRVGYRLKESIENNLKPILTSGVLPGTVQLTPSGKLVVLMRDCQVTGGYPRVLQLMKTGVNRLAQKSTEDKISFVLR